MKTVEFKFDLGEKVENTFGDLGIITMCAIDEGGNQYYLKTSNGGNWFKESEIKEYDFSG